MITVDIKDRDNIESFCKSIGYSIGSSRKDNFSLSVLGLRTHLRKINALGKKSIPHDYYIGSIEQRLSLLRGLMDSDGYICPSSKRALFTQKRDWISDLVHYLACSLGQQAKKYIYFVDGVKYNRVSWIPIWDINPFRLKRKAKLVRKDGNQSLRNYHRMITSYVEIDKEPMRCLTVDSPNSLFLCTDAFIPTHNTRTGAEWVRHAVDNQGCKRIGLMAPNVAGVRDVIFGGDSGLENISPPWNKPRFIHSKAEIIWPNGAKAKVYSAEELDALRGPTHDCFLWDEPAACKNPEDAYDAIQFGLRLTSSKGFAPRLLMTTTPRPIPLIKDLIKSSEDKNSGVLLVTGSTDENLENLDPNAVRKMYKKYEGTRLGRQELYAEVLGDHENALWTSESIDSCKRRISENKDTNVLDFINKDVFKRIVVGVDPSSGKGQDTQGIVVCGLDYDGEYHVLADESCSKSPTEWAKHIENVYHKYSANKIIVEKNGIGGLAGTVISANWKDAPIKEANAKGSKSARAEPVSMMYERGDVYHYAEFEELEKQMFDMTTDGYKGSGSPDRVDALVWAMWELSNGASSSFSFKVKGRMY